MTRDRPQRRRRRLRRAILLVLAVPVLLVALVVVGLRLGPVRHALLTRVGEAVQSRTGWALVIEDANFRPLLGDVHLRNISLTAPQRERPLLTAEEASLRIVLVSLLGEQPRLRTLSVSRPVVDLEQLPAATAADETPPASFELPVDIDHLALSDASVHIAPGESAAGWADRVTLYPVDVRGTLRREQIELRLTAETTIEGPRLGRRTAEISGQLNGTPSRLHLSQLTVVAPGLDLDADLHTGLGRDAPLSGGFTLTADLSRLTDGQTGSISGSGSFDVRARTGRLELDGEGISGELVAPWVPAEVAERYAFAETRASFTASVQALPGQPLESSLDLDWRRGQQTVLQVQASLHDGRIDWQAEPRLDALEGNIDVVASALPGEVLGPWATESEVRTVLAGGSLDLELEARLGGDSVDALNAAGNLSWRRGDSGLSLRLSELRAATDDDGGIEPTSLTGRLETVGSDVPAELLLPLLGRPLFERLAAAGSTLGLEGTAELRRGANPLAVDLRATWREDAEPLLALSARSVASRRDRRGLLDLDSVRLRLDLELPGLGDDRLTPLLGADLADRLSVADSLLVASASLVVGPGGLSDGGAEARWLGADGTTLLTARAEVGRGAPIHLHATLELLPAEAGRRRLTGELRAQAWTELASARLENGRLEIVDPSLETTLDVLLARWPGLAPGLSARPASFEETPSGEEPGMAELLEHGARGEIEATVTLAGPLADLEAAVELAWRPHPGASLRLSGAGHPARRMGNGTFAIEDLSLQALTPGVAGLVSGTVHMSVDEDGLAGAVNLTANGLEHGASGVCVNRLALVAEAGGGRLRLESLTALHRGTLLRAAGTIGLPPSWAELTLSLEDPDGGLEHVDLDLTVADGMARLESRNLRSRLGAGTIEASIPLGAVDRVVDLPPYLAEAWQTGPAASRTVTIAVLLPVLDSSDLAPFLSAPLDWQMRGSDVRLALELEPDQLSEARGTLEVGDLRIDTAEHRAGTLGPLRLRLAGRQLDLTPIRASVNGRPFDIRGHARLEPDQLAVAHLELHVSGNVDLALLDPLLLGGVGSGPLAVEGRLGGPPSSLSGRLVLDGSGGRIDYVAPYVSRFADPRAEVTLVEGTVQITKATAVLNEGSLEATGSWSSDQGLFLTAELDDVRYRLDYGLSALLDGDLELRLPAAEDERGSIQGEVIVVQGLVRRDIDLEREILRQLLAPTESLEGETTGDDIDLDIRLVSLQGIRVLNNIADLRATWAPLEIRGTLAEPTIDGTVEVDPGGLVFAYGQTLRIDRGTLSLRAEPGAEPVLDLSTTASYEDPTIGRRDASRSLDPFAEPPPQAGEDFDRAEAAALGLRGYVVDRLAAGAGEILSTPLAGTGISIRPVVVFNESDPTTSLTVGRDLTENLMLAVSINLREAERRTYLLQVDDLPQFPRMQGQVFTNEEGNEGATIQQTLTFGGDDDVLVGKVRVELPPGSELEPSALRRAISIGSREPLPDGVVFDTEIEVSDALRRRGYYSGAVSVRTVETEKARRVDVVVEVDPGPRIEVVFEGDRPPSRQRSAIATLYRADYYERASFEEMQSQTRRALHGEGFLEPEVEVRAERPAGEESPPQRIVVYADGGRRIDPDAPRFPGLEPEIETRLQERFASRQSRVELAAGQEMARSTVLSVLRNFGYPNARLVQTTLSAEGETLTVHVDPGARRHIASIEITGVDEERARELSQLLTIEPGNPVRSDRLAVDAIAVEDVLRREGFSEARVRSVTRPAAAELVSREDRLPTAVELRVERGPRYRLAEIELQGARKTRRKWALGITDLEPGETLSRPEIAEVRRRFFQTGLFSSVYVDTRLHENGDTTLVIGVDERPPLSFGYGLRWESEAGAGVVLDVLERNALGRGIALGARTLYTQDRQFGRIYSDVPYIFGTRYKLETFAQVRDDLNEQDLPRNELLTSIQLARAFGPHTTGRVYARYRRIDEIRLIEDPQIPFPIELEQISRTPFVGVEYIYDRRSDPLSGRKGRFAAIDLSGSGDFIGSDREYVRFFGQLNSYRPAGQLFGRRLGWAQSFRLGLAETFDDQRLIDPFLAGGAFSVRGYPTESLGPRDPDAPDLVLGGKALLILNEELHFPIAGRFSGVLFIDVGNVFASVEDIELDFRPSAGAGLRVDSPLGLLRLDVGLPLDPRPEEPALKVYVGFGQVF